MLKRECHDNQWFFLAILCGENNGGHQERSRKFMGKPRTAEWWPRSDRGQAGRSNFFQAEPAAGGQVVVLSFADWWTHSIRRQTADLRENLASNVGTDPQKIFFVEW